MIELYSGKNAYTLKQAVARKRADFTDEATEIIDAAQAEWPEVNQAIEGVSLFGGDEDRLVIIEGIEQNKSLADRLSEHAEQIPSSTYVLLVAPSIDKRSVLYKKVKSEGLVEEFSEPQSHELSRWLQEQAKAEGGSISNADARFLVERVGENQQLLAMEIAKLVSFTTAVSRESIEQLVEPTLQDTIFELLDSTTAGQHEKAREIYSRLRQAQVQPIYIIAMLGWQLHALLAVTLAGTMSEREIAAKTKISPFVIGKAKKLQRKIDRAAVREMLTLIADTDVRLKSQSVNADDVLEAVITRLAVISKG